MTKIPRIPPVTLIPHNPHMRYEDVTSSPRNGGVTKTVKKKRSRNRKKNKLKEIRVLYCNVNGIRGKIKSIETTVKTQAAHIIAIAETKGPPPRIDGYGTWFEKNRNHKKKVGE